MLRALKQITTKTKRLMNNSKFIEFINCLEMADSLNTNVIQIFQILNDLKNEVITELINLKPETTEYAFKAAVDKLSHNLKKYEYDLNRSKIDKWLKHFNTTTEEFSKWHTFNPNASHWHNDESSNNILYEILKTDINLPIKKDFTPFIEHYEELNKYDDSEKRAIQYHFEVFMKSLVINELQDFISSQRTYFQKESIDSLGKGKSKETNINPFPRVFTNYNAFKIFDEWSKKFIKNELADFSFIYRRMQEDELIYINIGDSEFRSWIETNYRVVIEKTKQIHRCTTPTKNMLYTSLKDKFKLI